ncbi:PTS glucose/sucrose transporter subunit IIB [Streptomyces sp. CB01881]|uniref:PTS glucose/sucrose transporter subunit IIB n=1 Tax=Streptomyces sp. CB01881 TaxID=2078691 RepID=UPI0023F7E904|nr:PTS glucose/sucrose transporter subunit IIB [Streptomyces sp. CB01881]
MSRCRAARRPLNPRQHRHGPTPGLRPGTPSTAQDGTRQSSRRAETEGEQQMASKAEKIVAGLGGIDNIEEVEGCITRLRTEVKDASLVNEAALKAAGAHGVVKMGTAIQVVIGTDADPIAADIEDMM